jgi:hypothetical protein
MIVGKPSLNLVDRGVAGGRADVLEVQRSQRGASKVVARSA